MDRNKLRLPPLPSSASGQEKTPQGGRRLVEVNGQPVWLDFSKRPETPEQTGISNSEQTRQLASRIKQKLGVS